MFDDENNLRRVRFNIKIFEKNWDICDEKHNRIYRFYNDMLETNVERILKTMMINVISGSDLNFMKMLFDVLIWEIKKKCDFQRLLKRIIDRLSKLRFISIVLFVFMRNIKMLNTHSRRLRSYNAKSHEKWKYEKTLYVWIEIWKKMFHRWSRTKKSEKMSRNNDNEDFIIRFSFVLCVFDWFK